MQLKLDTVDGCEGELAKGLIRVTRGAVITGLDVTDPAEVMLKAMGMPGMPVLFDMLSPRYPNVVFSRLAVRAIRGRIALLRLVYQQLTSLPDGGIETFAAEDVTTLSSGTTQLLPGTLQQLRVSISSGTAESDFAAGETATVSFPVPLRSIVLWGLFSAPPNIAVAKAIRTVNDAPWMGMDTGYWLFSGIRVQYSDRDQKFRVTCTTTSRCFEDWSSYAATKGPDGKFIRVPDAETQTLASQSYQYGIRYRKYGLLKVGLYKTSPFRALFGLG